MSSTYNVIASTTLGSNQTSVTFSTIPSTYTDLVMVANTRLVAGGSTNYVVTFNGDTGSNYSLTFLYGDGSVAGSGRASNVSNIDTAYFPNYSQLGAIIYNINNYSNTTTHKTIISRSGQTAERTSAYVGLWRNTAAITSMTINGGTNNIVSGSTFTLYGIKAE